MLFYLLLIHNDWNAQTNYMCVSSIIKRRTCQRDRFHWSLRPQVVFRCEDVTWTWIHSSHTERLTWLHRDSWKIFPSLPPQNRKYSQGSQVTDMISTSNRTDSSSSPEDSSQTCTGSQVRKGKTPAEPSVSSGYAVRALKCKNTRRRWT